MKLAPSHRAQFSAQLQTKMLIAILVHATYARLYAFFVLQVYRNIIPFTNS